MQTQVFDSLLDLRDLQRACDSLHALVDPGFGAPCAATAQALDRATFGAMLRVISRDLSNSIRTLEERLAHAGIAVPDAPRHPPVE